LVLANLDKIIHYKLYGHFSDREGDEKMPSRRRSLELKLLVALKA
jgi:hypothetical protein